jgi:hypothetical protein
VEWVHFGSDKDGTQKGSNTQNKVNSVDNPTIKHGHAHHFCEKPPQYVLKFIHRSGGVVSTKV